MKKDRFIEEVSKKVLAGKCDLFVGSGISRESKMPSWEELLEPLVEDLDITLTKEDTLPMIAQYVVNNNSGNKNIIYNSIEKVPEYAEKIRAGKVPSLDDLIHATEVLIND